MDSRSEVPPDTLPVDLSPEGVEVTYQDGRRVFYRGVPTKAAGSVTTAPGKDVHVLVTDADEQRGVLVYVDERKTEDEILEDTGVGRVLLDRDEETEVFPGVTVRERQLRVEVETDPTVVEGRVFVFEEDEMGERSFELVAGEETESTDEGNEYDRGDDDTRAD
ncbi:hypothetical protein BRD09_01820 [Halobacteriales archaeon SW_10_68_16]|jgi:hypothetical protein|nr:MAG: hypothetical protein BRD09_01820 [Halobacteriales archaeon SW_10_68_16]